MTTQHDEPVSPDHPLRIAWEGYCITAGYKNSYNWAAHEDHRSGAMWAAFEAGWNRGQQHQLTTSASKGAAEI